MNMVEMLSVGGVFVAIAGLLFGIRMLLFKLLDRAGRDSFPRVIRSVVATPSVFWLVALAALAAAQVSPLPPKPSELLNRILQVGILVSLIITIANLGEAIVRNRLIGSRPRMAESGLIKGIIRAVVYGTGMVMVLSRLGVEIGPLLTAMGVGGLVFAFAFKDTAENLFAGINLLVDRSVEVGDLIKIESGQEGIVEDIGWRVSKVTLVDDGLLIIPNIKLAQNITIRKKKNVAKSPAESTLLKHVS